MSEKNLKSEIKKRRGWDRVIKPRAPTKPKEPPKTITERVSYKYLGEKTLYDCAMFSLKELLRENIPTETIHLEFKKPYSDDDDFALEIYSIVEQEKENPNYSTQIKNYEKNLTKYKEAYKGYKQEIKEWKLWVKQEEMKDLQVRLEQAKEFIKMNEIKK